MTDPVRAAQTPSVGDASFDAYYYAHCCGDPYCRSEDLLRFFGGIADRVIADIGPSTVLDAGCAIGLLVESLRARGADASGIDLSSYAIGQVHESVRAYCHHGSIADELPRQYDLIVSIEVLEHMPARAAEAAIANFCRHTDDVVFSSSPSDYKEPTHVNVHPPEYWASEFARHGFYRDVDFDGSFITPWAIRFRRGTEPLHRIVRGYERRFWELTLERNDTRTYSMQVQNQLAVQIAQAEQLRREVEQAASALRQAQGEAEAARAEAQVAHQEAEAVRAEAQAAHQEAEAVRAAREDCDSALRERERDLAQARDRIHHMERSAFWRARMAFQRMRGSR